ncbi:MAG: hypothetical protein D6722_10580 [Bacteroidetes bacterium]|nr:MAG: hypothetical protein D6722_10580 [Bacteroidota bacterium]
MDNKPLSIYPFFLIVLVLSLINPSSGPFGHPIFELVPLAAPLLGTLRYMIAGTSRIYSFHVWDRRAGGIVLIFLALMIISIFRSNSFLFSTVSILRQVLPTVFLFTFVVYFVNRAFSEGKAFEEVANRIIYTTLIFLSIFAIMHVLAYLAFPNFGSTYGEGKLFSMFKINLRKRDFPLIGEAHPNALGIVIGGTFSTLLYGFLSMKNAPRWGRITMMAGIASSGFIILAADSRGTFLNAALIPSIIYGLRRLSMLRLSLVIVIALPVLQFLMLFLLSQYGDSDLLKNFSRGDNDLATGNSRAFIYKACADDLADFKEQHIFGYGQYGPYAAGVSRYYIDNFGAGEKLSKERKLLSSISHNSVFQVIFDAGYVGAFFFLATLFVLMKRILHLYREGLTAILAFLHFFLYFAFSGITESALGTYNFTYWLVFILFVGLTLMLAGNYRRVVLYPPKSYATTEDAYPALSH